MSESSSSRKRRTSVDESTKNVRRGLLPFHPGFDREGDNQNISSLQILGTVDSQTSSEGQAQNMKSKAARSRDTPPEQFGMWTVFEGDDATVDIVAIHGLGGHRVHSFTASNGVNWLRDLLPERLPRSRILSFGYDSSDATMYPHVQEYANSLVVNLALIRQTTETEERPIIWIAHCIGGIILKQALIYSNTATERNLRHHKAIVLSTYGILFLGTPHLGLDNTSFERTLLRIFSLQSAVSEDLRRELRRTSQMLQSQLQLYTSLGAEFETKFFYENRATTLSGGRSEITVPKSSAVVPGALDVEIIALDKDHSALIKFASEYDEGFHTVHGQIQLMLRKAAHVIDGRWDQYHKRLLGRVKSPANLPSLPYQSGGKHFIGRTNALRWIYEQFKEEHTLVLCGLGGIGKTRIAVEYIFAHHHEYEIVLWVNADTRETTHLSFRVIAQQLLDHQAGPGPTMAQRERVVNLLGFGEIVDDHGKIIDTSSYVARLVDAVKLWLSSGSSGSWLLVCDNHDDPGAFSLLSYLPDRYLGKVLVTSRQQQLKEIGNGYDVGGLADEDSVKLLLDKSGQTEIDEDAISIVQQLAGHVLAIVLAGTFIRARQLSFKTYINKHQEASQWNTVLKRDDTLYGRSLITAWEVSYRHIQEHNSLAMKMLNWCSFLDSNMIPLALFKISANEQDIEDALEFLLSFSFVTCTSDAAFITVHPLVHSWSRDRQDACQYSASVSAIIPALVKARTPHYFWKPHILACALHALKTLVPKLTGNTSSETWDALKSLAEYECGPLRLGMCWYALQLTKLGQETYCTALLDLAGPCYQNYQLDCLLQHCLQDCDAQVSVLVDVSRLPSWIYGSASELSKRGWDLLQDAVKTTSEYLGPDHQYTLDALHSFAFTLNAQGKSVEAVGYYQQALEGRRRILGADHELTLHTLHNIAFTLNAQGKSAEAVNYYQQVLGGERRTLGADHKDTLTTLTTLHNLAMALHAQGKSAEAVDYYQQVLEGRRRILGADHKDTLNTLHNLSSTLEAQGKWAEAVDYFQQALEGQRRILGADHERTLNTLWGLVSVLRKQAKYEEANQLLRRFGLS